MNPSLLTHQLLARALNVSSEFQRLFADFVAEDVLALRKSVDLSAQSFNTR